MIIYNNLKCDFNEFCMGFFDKLDLDLVLTCAGGVEKVLKSEVKRLTGEDFPVLDGELSLKGDGNLLTKLNLNLRTADRVFIKLGSFPVLSFDDLYDGVYAIDWKNILPKDARIVVNGKCVKSKIFAISACQSIVKKAIATKMLGSPNSRLLETGSDYEIQFRIFKDQCQILLNTSGDGLHKRGYRDMVGIAPIKETLASALVLLSDFYYERPFLDPFCGSGTIPIEATKIALNIAGSKGRKFAFMDWKNFNPNFYKKSLEEALDNEKTDRKIEIFGSDIDKKAIALSKRHLERAGLSGRVKFSVVDVNDQKAILKDGTIVTNPPYGERVYDKIEAEACYRGLGKLVREADNWSAFIITPHKGFEKNFGKRADRTRKLYNSNVECNYYFYYKNKGANHD